jgi:cystathionine beta-lyase/cystathionine gamma-synthase
MKKREINSSRVPVYRDSGFELYDAGTIADAFISELTPEREPALYIYSRYRNPTIVSAEEEIMKIEKCNWALLTQTGMSAIDTAVSIFQKGKETRPWLFFTEIYGGTISYIDSILKKRRGLEVYNFMPVEGTYLLNDFEDVMNSVRPEFVYLETVSNPLLIVTDVIKVIEIAKKYNSRVIVDNTFATPQLFKPLEQGADIVVHSATKYFSGHGNLTAGVLCGNDKAILQSALEYRKFIGHMLSPDDAYRLQTQIQSFELRFSRQCENASGIAEYLSKNPLIKKVWFPGLKSHATHIIAEKLFNGKGFGGMITFDFDGKNPDEKRRRRDTFIRNVSDKIKLIPTLGDPQTILMPVEAVWGIKYPEPGMIRLSVGFENYEDLKETIQAALEKIDL